MFEEAVGPLAGTRLETRLQRPDVLDVAGDAAGDGELLALDVEHRVHGLIERGNLQFAGGLELFPVRQHFVPEQRREQEAGRDALAGTDALVGIGQREHDELLAQRLFENDVEQRQQAMMQAFVTQPGDAIDRVARGQELEHLVEETGRRHVFQQFGHLADRSARRRVDDQPQLGGQAHGAQHAYRVLTVARARLADHPQGLLLEVADAMVVVDDRFGGRVVI